MVHHSLSDVVCGQCGATGAWKILEASWKHMEAERNQFEVAERKLHGMLKVSWMNPILGVVSCFHRSGRSMRKTCDSEDKRQLHQLWRKMAARMQLSDRRLTVRKADPR